MGPKELPIMFIKLRNEMGCYLAVFNIVFASQQEYLCGSPPQTLTLNWAMCMYDGELPLKLLLVILTPFVFLKAMDKRDEELSTPLSFLYSFSCKESCGKGKRGFSLSLLLIFKY